MGRGYDTHIVTMDGPGVPVPGARYHVLAPPGGGLGPRGARVLLAARGVRAVVRALRPDLVHAHYAWGHGFWGAVAGVHPLVVSAWGSDVMATGGRSAAHAAALRWILSRADVICATGPRLAQATSTFTPSPIHVTPFGVDTDLFHPAEAEGCEDPDGPEDSTVIGMVKRLDENSGIGDLLDALALPGTPRNLRVQVIGPAPDDRWVRRAEDLSLANRVEFLGRLEPHEVATHVRRWALAVQPSKYSEGFGVSALEASASGVPVVATRLGGLQDVVIDGVTGILVPPQAPDRLAAAIAGLLADPEARTAMGAHGRAHVVANYSLEAVGRAMDSVYAGVGVRPWAA